MGDFRFVDADVIESLAASLRERDVVTGAEVFVAHPGEYLPFLDAITFFGTEHHDGRPSGFGGGVEDHFEIFGSTYSLIEGKDIAAITAVRDRAVALLKELAAVLESDRTVGGLVTFVELGVVDFGQGHDAGKRWSEIKFELSCSAMS